MIDQEHEHALALAQIRADVEARRRSLDVAEAALLRNERIIVAMTPFALLSVAFGLACEGEILPTVLLGIAAIAAPLFWCTARSGLR